MFRECDKNPLIWLMLNCALYVLPVRRQDFGSVNPEIRIIGRPIIEVLLYFIWTFCHGIIRTRMFYLPNLVPFISIIRRASSLCISHSGKSDIHVHGIIMDLPDEWETYCLMKYKAPNSGKSSSPHIIPFGVCFSLILPK